MPVDSGLAIELFPIIVKTSLIGVCQRWHTRGLLSTKSRDVRCLGLATRPARVRFILGQAHALALIGQRAPGLGDFQNGLPVILGNRVSGQALAFGRPATVLGKDVYLSFLESGPLSFFNVLLGPKLAFSISRELTPGFRDL